MAIGRAEIQLPWGGDFSQTATGDLALVQDTAFVPAATQQRLVQLIQQNAIAQIVSSNGQTITLRPDDLFNPNQGASIRRTLGQLATGDLLTTIRSRILAGVALDPGISQSPAPDVSVTDQGNGSVLVSGSVYDVTGRYIPIPGTSVLVLSVS